MSSRLVELKYVDAQAVLGPLKRAVSKEGRIEIFDLPGRAAKSIFIQDSAQRMPDIERLIDELDVPLPPEDVNVTVNYSNASLLDVLRSLSEDTEINIIAGKDVTGNVTVHLTDVPLRKALDAILLSNGYTYIKEDEILRVVPLAEFNKQDALGMSTEVFVLKYANAEDLKVPLERIISKDGLIQIFTRTSANNSKARPNTIIVKDRPEVIKSVGKVLRELDKELSQVLIEAKFLSVELDDKDKMGVDWIIKAALTGSKVPTTLPLPNKRNSIDRKGQFIPQASPTSTDFDISKLFPYALKGDFAFGSLDFSQTSAVLQLLEQKQNIKVISAPRVAVLDGEEAMINVGKNYPIPLYEHSKDTGLQYISGYEEEKIGIILRVTPHLIGEDRIMLNLHPEVSEISGYVGPNNERPVVSTKEVSTSVSVANGDTIIIGGLIKNEETINNNAVPFIGKIPILGVPFRYKSKVVLKTELLIFLTPHVINKSNQADTSLLTQE